MHNKLEERQRKKAWGMFHYLETRQRTTHCGPERTACRIASAVYAPLLLKERTLPGIEELDKIFAATWLDDDRVLVGTKDNRLAIFSLRPNQKPCYIPLPQGPRPRSRRADTCGIHSTAINPSHTLLATGGDNPNDVAIFELPSFEPVRVLSKHEDWMFACAWLTDTMLASGSRDGTVKLWSVRGRSFINKHPVVSRSDHTSKVRDLKYCTITERMATLSQDTTCRIWDPHVMKVTTTVQLEHHKELVCLATNGSLAAVGSQGFISIIDTRCGHITKHIDSADEGWGVRSLSFRDNVLTCGGGKGRLSFFDLRANQYINLRPGCREKVRHRRRGISDLCYYTTGRGHLHENEVYIAHFEGQQIQHAVYAHEWRNGTQLLVAGGPLPFGLKGCYLAVW